MKVAYEYFGGLEHMVFSLPSSKVKTRLESIWFEKWVMGVSPDGFDGSLYGEIPITESFKQKIIKVFVDGFDDASEEDIIELKNALNSDIRVHSPQE